MEIMRVGVDLAKNVFQVHGVDRHEKAVWQRSLKRRQWLAELQQQVSPGAEIGMEACAGAHHWARELGKRGYRVKLMAPQFVKPYVKSNKTDRNDAEAICEAMSRPAMRFVAVKSVEQQDIQALHRVRSELVSQRTSKANQIRGLVGEYGLVARVHLAQLRTSIPDWLEDAENGLTMRFRRLLAGMWDDLRALDKRIAELDQEIQLLANDSAVAQRLQQLRGVGPITATALVAALGDGKAFRKGRDFAVSLGLTPRQRSSGGKAQMLGISKRGDRYLRTLMIHGARAVLGRAQGKDDPRSQWIGKMRERRHPNIVAVALANKNARIVWSILSRGEFYRPGATVPTN